MCVVVLGAIGAAGAYATTVTGTQNPDFRVRVSITPVHPTLGQTIVAHFSIWNMTGHNVNGEWQFTWSTPRTGIGASIAGTLGSGPAGRRDDQAHDHANSAKGRYVLYAEASDRHGSSHARAIATFR